MPLGHSGRDGAARQLQCELCKSSIAAKLSLAPYSVLFSDREGRNILLTTLLRFAYRLFLCRRLVNRYTLVHARRQTCTAVADKYMHVLQC